MSVVQHRDRGSYGISPWIAESRTRSRNLGRDLGRGVTFSPRGSKISRGNRELLEGEENAEENNREIEQESEDEAE